MSDRLATEIERVIHRDRGVVTLFGTLTATGTVLLHGGTEVTVGMWISKPKTTGEQVLVFMSRGSTIGIGSGDEALDQDAADARYVNTAGDTMDGQLVTPDSEETAHVDPLLSNVFIYADRRGATITSSVTGTATVAGSLPDMLAPHSGSYLTVAGGASGGTVTLTVSATAALVDPPSVPANAYWVPFMQWRYPTLAGQAEITAIQAEVQDGAGTWATAATGGTVPANGLYYTAKHGPASYPPRGVRFTFSVAANATKYLRALGAWHHSMPVGQHAFLSKGGGNVYGDILALPGTGVAQVIARSADDNTYLRAEAPANKDTQIILKGGGLDKWKIVKGGTVTNEDLYVNRYDDAGAYSGQPVRIQRSDGMVTVTGTLYLPSTGSRFIVLDTTDSYAGIQFLQAGVLNWMIRKDTSENFAIGRYDDSTQIDVPFSINRSTGIVTMPNIPRYRGLIGTHTVANGSTVVLSTFTDYTQKGITRSGSTFTIEYAGIYTFGYAARFSGANTAAPARMLISVKVGTGIFRNSVGQGEQYLNVGGTVAVDAGQTFTLDCYQNTGASLTLGAPAYFQMARVSDL